MKRHFLVLVLSAVLSGCAGQLHRDPNVVVNVPYCTGEPVVIGRVTIRPGRTTESVVRQNFGAPASIEPGPEPDRYRWVYYSGFDARRDPDSGAWTFELLNCRGRSRPGWSESRRVEFVFDSQALVSEVRVIGTAMPLIYE
ncbi:hypothetical protein [Vitreimonas sp.]|uniref:hypothetical protein n=1 Tax=Vitreimonas sp. TaxID=3069702 RepID=UPI002EDBAC24